MYRRAHAAPRRPASPVAVRLLALAVCAAVLPARAAVIDYQLVALGGSSYRYLYSVTNDGTLPGAAPITEFDLQFDPLLYDESSLTITSAAPITAGWSELLLSSAPGVPATYDALANGAGIAPGSTVSGFAVDFTWLGGGLPGSQPFDIWDPASNALIAQGTTGTTVAPVPLPSTVWILACGLTGLAGLARRRPAIRRR